MVIVKGSKVEADGIEVVAVRRGVLANGTKVALGGSERELIERVSHLLKCLSSEPKSPTAIADAAEAVKKGIFHDPTDITTFLCIRFFHSQPGAVSHLVRRVLLEVRQRSGAFSTGNAFDRFLLNLNLSVEATITEGDVMHQRLHPDEK